MTVALAQLDPTGIFDLPNTSLIFWEIITFLILLFLLWRYVYPPIRDQIRRRQSEIDRALDEARKQGEAQRERTKQEAREEGERIIQRAREEIERERDAALREVRREVADMVVVASERVIGRELDRDEHERLISEALDNLETEVAG